MKIHFSYYCSAQQLVFNYRISTQGNTYVYEETPLNPQESITTNGVHCRAILSGCLPQFLFVIENPQPLNYLKSNIRNDFRQKKRNEKFDCANVLLSTKW